MVRTALPQDLWGEGLLADLLMGSLGTEERLCGHTEAVPWETGYLQAVQEEFHAVEVEEHLTVVGRLVRDVPQGAPGELHHLVTLRGAEGSVWAPGTQCGGPLAKHGLPLGANQSPLGLGRGSVAP